MLSDMAIRITRKKIERQLLPADLEAATPLFFHLPLPFKGPYHHDPDNEVPLIALKHRIRELTDEDDSSRLANKTLGQFAVGLIRGQMAIGFTSRASGLYELTSERADIIFPCPEILRTSWSAYETGVGVKFQAAMNKLVEVATTEQPPTS
jgi:hypothetical protein